PLRNGDRSAQCSRIKRAGRARRPGLLIRLPLFSLHADVDGRDGNARDWHLAGGALTFAADDFEQVCLPPVGIHLEVRRHATLPLALLERALKVLGSDTVDEVDEALGRSEALG